MPRAAHDEQSRRSQTLTELGLVSASVIHEVKNALQGIASALFLLEHDPSLRPRAREWIASAQRELSRAFEASRQTLALVRQEAPGQVPVTEVLDQVLAGCSAKAAHKGITIERRYEFDGTIEANEGAIREVFTNLVLNAIEAAPRDWGKLAIHTLPSMRANGNGPAGVRILVADNGPGIPEKYKRKVFEPLFSTKKGKGTGLGLWVSDRLVHQQHGALQLVTSSKRENSGTCFSVFLPLKQN
jgi:signal transduction histidine kinase